MRAASALAEGESIRLAAHASSARNFMVYQRPEVGSMQMWADAVGDSSYTLDKMMPYFKKSATFTPPQSPPRHPNSTVQHDASVFDNSQGGPVQVTYSKYGAPFSTWMQPALSEIGLPQAVDFNGGTLDGHNWCTSTLDPKTMKRSSSQTAFLDQSQSRWNLHVQQLTTARKIIFDGNKTATGVQLSTGSTFFARKEVILSAGAFQSPQLLMVSGVGPAATLDKFNIPIIADRPGVGQNLTDHVFASPSYRVNVQTYTKLGNSIAYILWEFATNFLLKAGGVLTDPVCSYIGWEKLPVHLLSDETRSQLSQFPSTWPHIEYISAPGYIGDFSNLLTNQPKDGYQYASILAALVSPLSRGTVTITSSSTSDLPVIDPNWLSHPVDQAVMVAAYKRVRAAFASKAMAPILADPVEYYPGPDVHTDEQILDTIRKDVMTVWHAACTCRMGRVDDPTAVVDNKARVIGVNNLRVVDASAFALLPPGHPTSTIYALAEKIADDIKSGW